MIGHTWLPICVILLLFELMRFAITQEYCLATDSTPYLFFASKTAYEFVYERRISQQSVPGCSPVQIWMVGRYGTSYPNWERLKTMSDMASLRDQIIQNHESRRNGELCHMDRDALKNWRRRAEFDMADRLTAQGHQDMIFLAKRLKTNFPTLLDSSVSTDRFTFKFSDMENTRASAQAFAQELLGRVSPVYFTESNVDRRLSADNCSTLRDPEVVSKLEFEEEKFKQTNVAMSVVSSVSRRLGFLYNLSIETVLDIYDVCRYEKAWDYSKTSPWCAAFTKRDLKALEYFEDLKHFYKNGYGNNLAVKYGCPLVKNLMDNFQKAADNETDAPAGSFYFGSDALLESVMSRLGIANDKYQLPAAVTNMGEVEKKRQWRTAFISPFAGNIAAVFYKCTFGEKNKVIFYINEHTVEYEGCRVGLCSWHYLKERFSSVISQSCSYDFCDSLTGSAPLATSAAILVAFLVQIILLV